MFHRTISLVLVAAVFGCPLWCSMGLCQCSGDVTTIAGKVSECCQPTCCSVKVESETATPPGTAPPDSKPESLRCQGVCGGAVFESPCELPAVDLCRYLNCVDNDAPLLLAREHSVVRQPDSPEFQRAENEGRSVRIRLMSFQC